MKETKPWIMRQTWHDLLFAHWPVDPDQLRGVIPGELSLDLFDQRAWLGRAPRGPVSDEEHDDAREKEENSGRAFRRAREVPVGSSNAQHDRASFVGPQGLSRLDDSTPPLVTAVARILFVRPIADSRGPETYCRHKLATVPRHPVEAGLT